MAALLPSAYRDFAVRLALTTGVRVLLQDYHLAPEHPYPARVNDCFEVYLKVWDNTLHVHQPIDNLPESQQAHHIEYEVFP